MEINGWLVERSDGDRHVLARCPGCSQTMRRRKDTLLKNATCRDCYLTTRTKGGNRTARARVVRNYKEICAKGRGHEFSLDDDLLEKIFQGECHYCGSGPSNTMKYRRSDTNVEIYTYNGIDRKDSSLGYTEDNVLSACSICNRAKGNLSYEDFMLWIGRIK